MGGSVFFVIGCIWSGNVLENKLNELIRDNSNLESEIDKLEISIVKLKKQLKAL